MRLIEQKSCFLRLGDMALLHKDLVYMKMLKLKKNETILQIGSPEENEKDVKSRLDGACASFVEEVFYDSM